MRLQAGFSLLSEPTKQAILSEQNQLLGQIVSENIQERLGDQRFLANLWDRLTAKEREVTLLFLQKAPQGFFSKRDWDQLTKAGSAAWLAALTRLRRLGLIFTVRKLWSEIGYLMPFEVREALHIVTSPPEKISYNDFLTKSLSYYIPAGRGIHLDMFALLAHIFNEELPLTKKRVIHARYLPKLTSLLSLQDKHAEGLLKMLLPDSNGSLAYSPPLSLLLDACMRLGFIKTDGTHLQVTEERLGPWLGQPVEAQLADLLQTVVDQYLAPEPWLAAAHFELVRQKEQGWQSVSELLDQLAKRGVLLPEDAEQRLLDQWLHPMLGFGFIQLGSDHEGRLYCRWSNLAQTMANGWYMEPTGDLLIPAVASLSLLWQLVRYADLSFEGELVRGSLQASKIQNELAHGAKESEILQFLQDHCFHPVPESVKEQIDQWAKMAKQIRLEHVVCVRTADRRVLDELIQLPSLAPFLTEIISDNSFLIAPKQERELLRLLKEYGYQPIGGGVVGIREPASSLLVQEDSTVLTGLFDIRHRWQEYQIENVFPEYAEAIPQLALIPKLWTQHYQSYHPKTVRDLLARARELELTVQVETQNGELAGVVQSIQVENGYWCVTMLVGKKLHRCTIEEVKRARILLPQM